jgi:hypothetical protein
MNLRVRSSAAHAIVEPTIVSTKLCYVLSWEINRDGPLGSSNYFTSPPFPCDIEGRNRCHILPIGHNLTRRRCIGLNSLSGHLFFFFGYQHLFDLHRAHLGDDNLQAPVFDLFALLRYSM